MTEIRNKLIIEEIENRHFAFFKLIKEFAILHRDYPVRRYFSCDTVINFAQNIRASENNFRINKLYLFKLYDDLYGLKLIDHRFDTNFNSRLKRISNETFQNRIIRNQTNLFDNINNIIDDLFRIIYVDARYNNLIYKRLVRKRTIFTHSNNWSNNAYNKSNKYIISTRKQLTYGIIHFYLQKVESKPICSICYESFESLENKGILTVNYTNCGHIICQKCEAAISTTACPTCRCNEKMRRIITVNKGYCAGLCCKPLDKCKNYLLASCGHIYCGECIDHLMMSCSALLTYICTGTELRNCKQSKICRICDINMIHFNRIFLIFD